MKEQILPFYAIADELYREKLDALTKEQSILLTALQNDICDPANEYLTGYIESFSAEMKTVMNYLFERDAIYYTTSEHAHEAAFADYSYYCGQPYVFLGRGVQDVLSLVHELGHYTAYYHFPDEQLPYDTAEVHSQGNEWLFMYYLNDRIDRDVYEVYLLRRLCIGLETVILTTVVDEYEEAVYTSKTIPSADSFQGILEGILDGYVGIDRITDRNYMYTYIQHVTIQSPVYYLSYATSELAAMTFYSFAREEGYEEAQEVYTKLCLETPVGEPFFDTLSDVGLPDPFQFYTVRLVVDSFSALVEENGLQSAA